MNILELKPFLVPLEVETPLLVLQPDHKIYIYFVDHFPPINLVKNNIIGKSVCSE